MPSRPVTTVTVIIVKPDRGDEFAALQLAQHERLRGAVPGLLGSRFLLSPDKRTAILIARFESAEIAASLREDPRITEHIARVRPLIEDSRPGGYDTLFEYGTI